ncbi:FkbM family methyltransferase [Pseudobutyrivibrio ruminis]|uniref:FkbM family methyltransferase n=1 Tax=Pseudobutyrivibrio ruminis TaxID=46206 RepID=UPI0004004B99|nr:FkbM family methyltransferase [Pseudobutyrivibrio ruminis]
MKNEFDVIRKIYSRLSDDKSKRIFCNRLNYNLSNSKEDLFKLVSEAEGLEKFPKQICKSNNILFGAGARAQSLLAFYSDEIIALVDSDTSKQGSYICQKPILSPDVLKEKYLESNIIVANTFNSEEIVNQLYELGVQKERIINIGESLNELNRTQYFGLRELSCEKEEEVFIDAGCYDGVTVQYFLKWCSSKDYKIYSFEPDDENYKKICDKQCEKWEIINKGLWGSTRQLSFNSNSNSSRVSTNGTGDTAVEVISLDDFIRDKKVTFIKMDIEGAEYEALLGAKRIIIEQKPKLAICVYHKPEDIIDIPQIILSFNQEYKLYLRHYWATPYETVLYAI